MAAVTVLTQAAQARSGASAALDVSAYSTARLDLVARANLGLSPHPRTWIETAPNSSGPWRVIAEQHRTTGRAYGSDGGWPLDFTHRLALSGLDRFLRIRWAGGREGEGGNTAGQPDPGFNIGLTGDAI